MRIIDRKYIDDYVTDAIDELSYQQCKNIDRRLIRRFYFEMISFFEDKDKELEKDGYKYLYEIDEEEIIDICDRHQIEFQENGEIYSR